MQPRFYHKIKHCKILALILLCNIPRFSIAAGLEVKPSFAATTYVYETKEEGSNTQSNQALVVIPSLLASYSSKRLLTSLTVNHTKVKKRNNIDIENNDNSYSDYKYKGALALIPKTLNVTISSQQDYRVLDQQQDFVTDKVLVTGQLTKYNSHLGSIDFIIPNPKYFGLDIQSSYSETNTEDSINGLNGLNGNNRAASIQLYQGRNARNYAFNFTAQYNDTNRTNSEDFKSSIIQGSVGISLIQNISFILTGNAEKYDVNQETFLGRTNLDSTSYGAGIEWKPKNEKMVRVTYNQLKDGENKTNFVGVNLDWELSNRTGLKFDYGKRFYGDAYSINFNHALKSVRSSINYTEQVTSYARLENTTNPIGLFVCQLGSADLVDCFQPDNTNYQLQAGEEFRTLIEITSDVTEEVLFVKSGSFNLAYQKRRLKASINASYRKTEYLESNRLQTNKNMQLNLVYSYSKKTNFAFSTVVSRQNFNQSSNEDTLATVNLSMDRNLANNIRVSIGARLIDRESEIVERNVTDKRLTFGFNYTF